MHIKKLLLSVLLSCFALPVSAQNLSNSSDFRTTEEILAMAHAENTTNCAAQIFSNALIKHADKIDESEPESKVRAWAKETMTGDADVLKALLNCPEIKTIADDTTIIFSPVEYKFPGGRTLTINYSTQPKVLKQKLILANKRSLPNGNASPDLTDISDGSKYLNTEPAWYAIMVVQHDSLRDFVGAGKNNTLSVEYINDHIDSIYPRGYYCTSKSAWANDTDTINQVVHEVVKVDDDTNDYYVAGDANLEWVMYAEIAADALLTVATAGGGTFVSGYVKGLRATKTGIRLFQNVNKLKRFARVEKYVNTSRKIELLKDYEKVLKNLETARKTGKDVAKYEKEADEVLTAIRRIDPKITENALELTQAQTKALADIDKNIARYEKQIADLHGKNPSKAKELRTKITDQKYARNKILNQKGTSPVLDADKIQEEIKQAEKTIKELTDVSDDIKKQKTILKQAQKAANSEDIKKYNKLLKELEALEDNQKSMISISRIKDPGKKAKAIEQYEQNQKRIKELQNSLAEMEKDPLLSDYAKAKQELDDLQSIEKYQDSTKQLEEILVYHKKLNAFRRPQTGNIVTRNLKKIIPTIKSIHAANNGAKTLAKAGKVARAGMSTRSAKIGQYLTDATLKHGARLAQFESKLGKLYGFVTVAQILGDMYDKTSTTSKEFSNGIEFKPLCLLSADDLEGQENVVNYGMWLMWVGDSTDISNDDAAYLQAMDFASKFYYQLDEFQDEHGANCNVDIYVVRPIIRLDETNVDDPSGELFYLFMNEIPWSTAEQFGDQVPDIEDWERTQSSLEQQDPNNKYKPRKETSDNDEDDDEDIDESDDE